MADNQGWGAQVNCCFGWWGLDLIENVGVVGKYYARFRKSDEAFIIAHTYLDVNKSTVLLLKVNYGTCVCN